MPPSPSDRIEKQIILPAPRARVWQALTDSAQFGRWFGARFAEPFVLGQVARGQITYPGYQHLTLDILIETITPETKFAFRWHPHAVDTAVDYSTESMTLVTFTLEDAHAGTRLTVVESGFDGIPRDRRPKAFAMNSDGWNEQLGNIAQFVATAGILHDLPINRPPSEVYRGLVDPEGLNAWWTNESAGQPTVGNEYRLQFGAEYDWRAVVTAAVPDRVIEWKITRALPDWVGTTIRFVLEPTATGTRLQFAHTGWAEASDHFRQSSYCWALYLRVLTRYLEHGEVVAYEERLRQ